MQRFDQLSYLRSDGLNQTALTEKEIIQGCLKKEPGAEHALFLEYSGILMTICRRYGSNHQEAEDMLQEAFIRIFRYIGQYKSTGSFEGWIKRITVNSAVQVLQNKKIRFSELSRNHNELQAAEPDIFSDLSADDLLKLISQLPDGYRVVFNLYALEGYSHEEIARILQIKTATSRSQLSKARSLLREKINSFQKISE
jgi:RNA polymerase sigma factor (sigma-70 family)